MPVRTGKGKATEGSGGCGAAIEVHDDLAAVVDALLAEV